MKKKNPNDMMTTSSEWSPNTQGLVVFCEQKPIPDDGTLVPAVVAGYSVAGEFGYFVCDVSVVTEKNVKVYRYTNVKLFERKVDEKTYQYVLEKFKNLK